MFLNGKSHAKLLTPLNCVVFSNVAEKKKSLSFASREFLVKRFLLCQEKLCATKKAHFFLAASLTLVVVCFLSCRVNQIMTLGVHFLFHNQSLRKKRGGEKKSANTLQKCGGVQHLNCNTRLGSLMFARCALEVSWWKLNGPSLPLMVRAGVAGGNWELLVVYSSSQMMGKVPGTSSEAVKSLQQPVLLTVSVSLFLSGFFFFVCFFSDLWLE